MTAVTHMGEDDTANVGAEHVAIAFLSGIGLVVLFAIAMLIVANVSWSAMWISFAVVAALVAAATAVLAANKRQRPAI